MTVNRLRIGILNQRKKEFEKQKYKSKLLRLDQIASGLSHRNNFKISECSEKRAVRLSWDLSENFTTILLKAVYNVIFEFQKTVFKHSFTMGLNRYI